MGSPHRISDVSLLPCLMQQSFLYLVCLGQTSLVQRGNMQSSSCLMQSIVFPGLCSCGRMSPSTGDLLHISEILFGLFSFVCGFFFFGRRVFVFFPRKVQVLADPTGGAKAEAAFTFLHSFTITSVNTPALLLWQISSSLTAR